MIGTRRQISLGLSPEKVREGQHVCYIYNDEAERRRVMAKYVESGLLEGEKVLCFVDAMTPDEMVESLEELGVSIRDRGGSLTLADAESAYCPSGRFVCEEMISSCRDFYQDARAEGYVGARVSGEMSACVVNGLADPEEVIQYESRLNDLLDNYPLTACCQYDARRFDGEVIMDVLSVHPVMIVRGQLVRNPFYVEPSEFLREYRERKGNHA